MYIGQRGKSSGAHPETGTIVIESRVLSKNFGYPCVRTLGYLAISPRTVAVMALVSTVIRDGGGEQQLFIPRFLRDDDDLPGSGNPRNTSPDRRTNYSSRSPGRILHPFGLYTHTGARTRTHTDSYALSYNTQSQIFRDEVVYSVRYTHAGLRSERSGYRRTETRRRVGKDKRRRRVRECT
jgi:hypothetical protein